MKITYYYYYMYHTSLLWNRSQLQKWPLLICSSLVSLPVQCSWSRVHLMLLIRKLLFHFTMTLWAQIVQPSLSKILLKFSMMISSPLSISDWFLGVMHTPTNRTTTSLSVRFISITIFTNFMGFKFLHDCSWNHENDAYIVFPSVLILQNGPDECKLNALEACAIDVMHDVVR